MRRGRGVALMLAGQSDTEIAAALGVARQTVRRWRLHPDVRERLAAHTEAAGADAGAILAGATTRAAQRLVELVEADGHVGVRACVAVLKLAGHGQPSTTKTLSDWLGELLDVPAADA